MSNYILNIPYVQKRQSENYKTRDKIADKWEAVEATDCDGNWSMRLYADKQGKIHISPVGEQRWRHEHEEDVGVYEVMPSAMWLYRIACTFKPHVTFYGPDGYKLVWATTLRHKATGCLLHVYEWKGAVTFGASHPKTAKVGERFDKAALELLNYLASPHCLHPYDGCVAGSVA